MLTNNYLALYETPEGHLDRPDLWGYPQRVGYLALDLDCLELRGGQLNMAGNGSLAILSTLEMQNRVMENRKWHAQTH